MLKKSLNRVLLIASIMAGSALFNGLQADPPPPPAGGEHGTSGNQTGGGAAPLTGGAAIMLTLSAAYGIKRIAGNYKKATE